MQRRAPTAKAFWQHTGLGLSSRQAAIALGKETSPSRTSGDAARELIRKRLASIHGVDAQQISLHPAGMAGLYAALSAIQTLRPGKPTLQLGFPYVDVLKQPQVVFHGGELLQPQSLAEVEAALDQLQPAAVIVELPSNPLLRCMDLPGVSALARSRGIPVIADDTIGTGINLDALPYADLIFTSLTKSFAGRGDVMAGSVLVSPQSPWAASLLAAVPSMPPSAMPMPSPWRSPAGMCSSGCRNSMRMPCFWRNGSKPIQPCSGCCIQRAAPTSAP